MFLTKHFDVSTVQERSDKAMAEEFENYEARIEEARKAVERWEAEGGAPADEQGPSRHGDPSEAEQGVVMPEERETSKKEADDD
jgi:hypothetical protein